MGKYMKKSNKTASEVSVMEGPQNPTSSSLLFGVLTRAKTLALKKLGLLPAESPAQENGGGSFIQLRSRRLERPVLGKKTKKKKRGPTKAARARAENQGGGDVVVRNGSGQLVVEIREQGSGGVGSQGSVGGNASPLQQNEREQREATPSTPRNPIVMRTPGIRTRPRNSTVDNGSVHDPVRRPSQQELDAFFSAAEKLQQRQFMEKYNFDPVNEKPLPGRYEWVKVDP